jgi:uncharacterized protein
VCDAEKVKGETQFEFDWDKTKAISNKRKHGVAFHLAATIFRDPFLNTVYDHAHSQREDRFFSLGRSITGAILAVSHTFSETGLIARVRIISARKATKPELKTYEKNYP